MDLHSWCRSFLIQLSSAFQKFFSLFHTQILMAQVKPFSQPGQRDLHQHWQGPHTSITQAELQQVEQDLGRPKPAGPQTIEWWTLGPRTPRNTLSWHVLPPKHVQPQIHCDFIHQRGCNGYPKLIPSNNIPHHPVSYKGHTAEMNAHGVKYSYKMVH